MAPKLPTKFDDINKTASSVLNDDFHCEGYAFKSKQKTNVGGGSTEVHVDCFGKGDIQTPAKMTLKFPTPFSALQGFAIDKFELDKSGKAKLDLSFAKALHGVDGLKLEVKNSFPLKDPSVEKTEYHASYTAIKDTTVKVEAVQQNLSDFRAEALYGIGAAVIGARLDGISKSLCPSAGVSYTYGDFFYFYPCEEAVHRVHHPQALQIFRRPPVRIGLPAWWR
jgi:hypothetical protein